jgi:hypothetical protein
MGPIHRGVRQRDDIQRLSAHVAPVRGNFPRENFPGATGGTQVVGIDAAGDTVGFYIDPMSNTHGFFKPVGGSFTTVDQPGSAFNRHDLY